MITKTSAKPMLSWQYRILLGELSQVTFHSIDDSCPCQQVDLDPPEYCLGKHLLNIQSLASETYLMDAANADMLDELASEALEYHEKAKEIYCKGGVWPELAQWSREWRKKIEPIYYACGTKAKLKQDAPLAELEATLRPIPKEQLPFDFDKPWVVPSKPTIVPATATTPAKKYTLFPFQADGVAWLKGRPFALLADDMGLGKTPQAIYWGTDNRPVLVIVPAALTFNWKREITEMWRPGDKAIILDGKQALPKTLPDWTILSYGMLNRYLPELKRAKFQSLIVDEAHSIKNLDAQRTKNVLELVAPSEPSDRPIPNRLAVTGTPVLNRPIELFVLLVFLGVKQRREYRDFMERYTEHKVVKGRTVFTGAKNLSELNQLLKGFMLRRLKKDVLKELPPKINTPLYVAISNRDEYVEAERNFLEWLANKAGDAAAVNASRAEIITKMNALRQLAAMGKVVPVCDWLKPCRDGQGKVIVFSTFNGPLEDLALCKPGSVIYNGAVSSEVRQDIVDRFQHDPGMCYFLGTVGAAGVGITLTAASRVCFLDLPWTPGGKAQAEDRAHRIGQIQPVEIVNVLARGTIDERMLKLLADKEFIIAQTIDGKQRDEAISTSITQNLMDDFMRDPTLNQNVVQYQPDPVDPDPEELAEIAEGFRQVKPEVAVEVALAKRDKFLQEQALSRNKALIDEEILKAGNREIGMRVAADRLQGQVDTRTGMPIEHNITDAQLIRKAATLPAIPSTCKVIKVHDDGDKTLKCKTGTFVVTTEGARPAPEVTIPEGVRPPLYVADIEGMAPDTAKVVKTVSLLDGSKLVLKSDKGDIYGLINNQEIGFATKLSDTETDLSVAMEFRNKGIGTELMRQFRKENPSHPTGGLTEGGAAVIRKLEAEVTPPVTEGKTFKETQAKLLAPKAGEKVLITGKCGASVDTCTFTIRRKGKPHLVTKEVKTAKVTTCKANTVSELVKQSKELLAGNRCSLKQPSAKLHQEPTVKITGTCTASGCSLKVKGAIEKIEASNVSGLADTIDTVIRQLGKRETGTPSPKTFAPGISTSNRYEFQFKIIDADDLIVSHDPFTFALNPKYTAKIQPRIRERLANQMQVRKIAARLDPEKLLLDTKAIDTGSPIIGPDNIVECGNGRVMALILAAKEHPANIVLYRQALKEVALDYGLAVAPIDKMKLPVLVRLRLTSVDRQAFAEECNARPTIETSSIEKARTDADKITPAMLSSIDVLEGEPIEKALRSERNKAFVSAYLSKVPENEQAGLIDSRGYLSSDGIRRMVMGIFTATFKGDTGIKLAEKFFEAIDETGVKNAFNGILRSLGIMAQAENLVASGQRESDLAFGEDLAKTMTVFSNIRGADMSVKNYLAQMQMLERQLTPFQEIVLKVLDEHTRSAKRIGNIFSYYAQSVIDSAPPGQVAMITGLKPDKSRLFAAAVKRVVEEFEVERAEKEARKKREPIAAMGCGLGCVLLADYTIIKRKLRKCNLSEEDFNLAMNWRPLRNLLATALGWKNVEVELCSAGMVPGVYQVTINGLSINNDEKITKLVMKTTNMKQVYTKVPGQRVYEAIVPETKEAKELAWTPQAISHIPARSEGAQAAMFASPHQKAIGLCGVAKMEQIATLEHEITIEAQVNDKAFPLKIDTGTSYVGLTKSDVAELGLERIGTWKVQTAVGIIDQDVYWAWFKYNGFRFPTPVQVSEVGVLGTIPLEIMRLKVNPAEGKLEQRDSKMKPEAKLAGFTTVHIKVYNQEKTKSKEYNAMLVDTGADWSLLPNKDARELGLPFFGRRKTETIGGIVELDYYLGWIEINNDIQPMLFATTEDDKASIGVYALQWSKYKVNPVEHKLEPALLYQSEAKLADPILAEMAGETKVDIGVTNIGETDLVGLDNVIVDTGSTFSSVPPDVIRRLKMPFVRKQLFELSDKRKILGDLYLGKINIKGKGWVGEISSEPIAKIGLDILEKVGFRVNPITRQLEEYPVIQYYTGAIEEAKMADPILAEIASQICATGACFASSPTLGRLDWMPLKKVWRVIWYKGARDVPMGDYATQQEARDRLSQILISKGKDTLPICSKAKAKKLERCILKIKARNVKTGCKPEGDGSKECPNPFAVCRVSVGCRLGGEKG